MASEWNRAIRLAQQLITQQAESLPSVEGANRAMVSHPHRAGMDAAAKLIDALVEPESTT